METETLRINYWKGINKELDDILKDIKGIIFLIHNSAEIEDILGFLTRFRPQDQVDILYISLIRSYYHIKLSLEGKDLGNRRLFILDSVTSMITDVDEEKGFEGKEKIEGIFRKPPSDFNKLKDLIIEGLDSLKKVGTTADIIVIDSISQLINLTFPTDYQLKGFYNFLEEMRRNVLGVIHDTLIILYDDKIGYLKHLPVVHSDHIIRMEVIKEKPTWRG